MKRSDIAMIGFIAVVVILIAFFATNALFGGAEGETVNVKTIERIDSSLTTPSDKIFNKNAINPTYKVNVGTTTTTTP